MSRSVPGLSVAKSGVDHWSEPPWSDWASRKDPTALPHPHSVVYICAPYGHTAPEVVKMNVEDAEQLARFAVHMGYSPIVVHSYIDAVFGDDNNPVLRKRGLGCVVSIAWSVARSRGHLWVVQRENGTLSDGCQREVNIFHSHYGSVQCRSHVRYGTWSEWLATFAANDFET